MQTLAKLIVEHRLWLEVANDTIQQYPNSKYRDLMLQYLNVGQKFLEEKSSIRTILEH